MSVSLINKYKEQAREENQTNLSRVNEALNGKVGFPENFRFQFLTTLQSKIGYPEDFITSYRQYIMGLENQYLGLLDTLDDETSNTDNYNVFVLGDVFRSNDIRYCILHPDEEVIVSINGIDYDPDLVFEAMGASLASSQANLAFLETIVQTSDADSISSKVDLLKNKLEIINGPVTSKNADYYEYITSIITNCPDNQSALMVWLQDQQCTEEISEDGNVIGFNSRVEGLTGQNPLLTLLSGIEIPVDTILGGIASIVTYTIAGLGYILWGIVKSVIKVAAWAVLKIAGWIVDKFINPNDITTTANETGDPVLDQLPCVTRIHYGDFRETQDEVNRGLLYARLNDHPGEYLRLFTLGATFYLGVDTENKDIVVYTYKHIYDANTASKMLSILRSNAFVQQSTDAVANRLQNHALPLLDFSSVGERDEEYNVYVGYVKSNKLIEFGVYAMDINDSNDWKKYYFPQFGNSEFYDTHTFSNHNSTDYEEISRPTNNDWRTTAQYSVMDDGNTNLSDTIFSKLFDVVIKLLDNNPASTGIYMPYIWTANPSPSRFRIKTDKENAESTTNAFITIAVTAAIITAAVVGLKIRRNINAKALRYQREAYNATSNPDITDAQYKKLVKKSKRYSAMSGKSYLDVTPSNPISDSSDRVLTLIK